MRWAGVGRGGYDMKVQELHEEGWRAVEREIPPVAETVEFARDEEVCRQPPWFGRWQDLDPACNVAGLWWRRA